MDIDGGTGLTCSVKTVGRMFLGFPCPVNTDRSLLSFVASSKSMLNSVCFIPLQKFHENSLLTFE